MREAPVAERVEEASRHLLGLAGEAPSVGLILGSGLSGLAGEVEGPLSVPYDRIPNFPELSVPGHEGLAVLGRLEGRAVAIMAGRPHYYEGRLMAEVAFPTRVLARMGARTLVVTNAAGGLDPSWARGDIMILADHINLVGMAGPNPLRGREEPELGPRFFSMAGAYDEGLRERAWRACEEEGAPCHEGVYAMVAGPSLETPAEIRALRTLGADAVGMSTAPEVVAARQMGLRVLGLSLITNLAGSTADHEDVLAAGKRFGPRMAAVVRAVLRELAD